MAGEQESVMLPAAPGGAPEDKLIAETMWGAVQVLEEQGKSKKRVARELALDIKTVRKWWRRGWQAAGVLSFEGPVELEAIATRHGLKVAAYAHGAEGILATVKAGVASIEHGSTLNEEIFAEMKQRGTYLVPTTYLANAIDLESLHPLLRAKAEAILPVAKASLRAAIKAGVKIAFGTDAAVYPHGLNAREFASLADRGMTPLEAIRTATLNAGDLLGVEDRGVLKAGLLADIIAVSGNPLEDVRTLETVDFVMKGG